MHQLQGKLFFAAPRGYWVEIFVPLAMVTTADRRGCCRLIDYSYYYTPILENIKCYITQSWRMFFVHITQFWII